MTAPLRFIDRALLDAVSNEAAGSPRLRKNRNFHAADDFPAHRLLNAVEPGSYVPPHRHCNPLKDETMVVVRGRLGIVTFDDAGDILAARVLEAGGDTLGVDIPHGTWHSVLGLTPGTIFFEAKAGPYAPPTAEERAPWAPLENDPAAATYYQTLRRQFP